MVLVAEEPSATESVGVVVLEEMGGGGIVPLDGVLHVYDCAIVSVKVREKMRRDIIEVFLFH